MNKFYTDEQKIIDWLDKYDVKSYTLVPDEKYGFVVDVNGDVNLSFKELINIPIKFNKISGSFYYYNNKLTSLEFSCQTVGGNFYCSDNQLTFFEFCPQAVRGSFNCHNNQLTSLEFCPQKVEGIFYCKNNPELKEIQEITDFKLIYLEHKKILIDKLSDKLENDLINDNSKKTAKIKI